MARNTSLCVLLCLVLACRPTPLHAQTPPASSGSGAASGIGPAPAQPTLITPPSVALVQFNNRVLFPVYTFEEETAADRADLANLRLAQALRDISSGPEAGRTPRVTVGTREGQTLLLIDLKPLLTVTDADADHNSGRTVDQLAQVWADQVDQAFQEAVRERQPAYLRWALGHTALLLAFGLLLHGLVFLVSRRRGLHPGVPLYMLLWVLIAWQVIDLFPQTRPVEILLLAGPLRPVTLCLVTCLPAAILVRSWSFLLRRLFPALPENLPAQERTERTYLRHVTLARVAEVTGATFIWIVAAIIAMTWNGLNLSALLASAGLVGVALGLVAQDAMKDFVAGIYILADDRFGVGDTIQVGAYEGRVERLNLRATQLRDMAGRLVTISNRSIVDVANLTARWAQVDFKVGVSYYDDVEQATALLAQAAQALADEWPERVIGSPEMLGVDAFTDVNLTLRLVLRTPPGDQWVVARELRRRVKLAFDGAGIVFLNTLYAPPPLRADRPHAPAEAADVDTADGRHAAGQAAEPAAEAFAPLQDGEARKTSR